MSYEKIREFKTHFQLWDAARQFRSTRGTFYGDLAERMDATKGVGLKTLFESYAERYKGEPLGVLCAHWAVQMDRLGIFSKAVKGTLPNEDISLLVIAEEMGDLKFGLSSLGANLVGLKECKSAITTTLAIVGFLVVITHIFVLMQAFYLFPLMENAIKYSVDLEKIGGVTSILFKGSHFIQKWIWVWLAVIVVLAILIPYAMKNLVGELRKWLDNRFFPFQLTRDFNGASFLTALGSISKLKGPKKIELREGLKALSESSYPWLKWQVSMILENYVTKPNAKAQIFDTGVTNRETYFRMQDISDYDEMDVMLNKIGDIILKKTPDQIERKAKKLKFITMAICMGIMISIFGSIIVMSQEIKQHVQMHNIH